MEKDKLCGFRVGEGLCAISIFDVQELAGAMPVVNIPLSPDYIEGLANLRGQIVTVVNLRKFFNIKDGHPPEHINIIVDFDGHPYSLMVDNIVDIFETGPNTLEKEFKSSEEEFRESVYGTYKLKDDLVMLLDLDKIFNKIKNIKRS